MDKAFLILCFGLLFIPLYYWYFTSKRFKADTYDLFLDMENQFFNEVTNGKYAQRIAFIYSMSDLIIVKSLFESEQIPFFCEFEHLSKVKTGLPITQVNNIILNVLEDDINDAIFIITEYKKNKSIKLNRDIKIRSVLELVFFFLCRSFCRVMHNKTIK